MRRQIVFTISDEGSIPSGSTKALMLLLKFTELRGNVSQRGLWWARHGFDGISDG